MPDLAVGAWVLLGLLVAHLAVVSGVAYAHARAETNGWRAAGLRDVAFTCAALAVVAVLVGAAMLVVLAPWEAA